MMELNRPQLSVSDGSPLPRRTGHGDFPHPALAKVVSSRKHSQGHQAQVFQVSVKANPCPCAPAALTASAQVLTQAASHEMIEVPKRLARIAQPEIVGPSSQVRIQSPNQFRHRCVALLRVNELAQRLPFPRHRLAGWLQVQVTLGPSILVLVIPKGVAQKIQTLAGLSHIQHASLFPVDLQPQPSFQFALNPAAQLRADVASQYDKTVRIAYQVCLGPLRRSIGPLKQVVEPVQVDVGQQGTQDASLRST